MSCKWHNVGCTHPNRIETINGEKYYPICKCNSDECDKEHCDLYEEKIDLMQLEKNAWVDSLRVSAHLESIIEQKDAVVQRVARCGFSDALPDLIASLEKLREAYVERKFNLSYLEDQEQKLLLKFESCSLSLREFLGDVLNRGDEVEIIQWRKGINNSLKEMSKLIENLEKMYETWK